MILEDIYDVLALLIDHAGRTGLGEALINDARSVLAKADPKLAAKLEAAKAAAEQEARDRADFEAFKKFQAGNAAPAAPAAEAPPVVTS